MRVAERLQRAQLSSKVVTSEVVRRSARNVEPGQHLQALQDRMTDKSHGTRGDASRPWKCHTGRSDCAPVKAALPRLYAYSLAVCWTVVCIV